MAKKGVVIPNFKLKFAKSNIDYFSLNNSLKVLVNSLRLFISPLEVQISFKLWLGSEKDIEDSVYIYELFKEKLDKSAMEKFAKELKVKKVMVKYGIV